MSRLRSLASDTVIYGLMTVFGRFITFMLTPIYTNFISQSAIGEVNNIFAYFALIVIFYSFGMESAYFRFYSKNDSENNIKVFSHSFLFMTIIGLISTVLLLAFSSTLAPEFYSMDNAWSLFALSALIPLTDIIMYIPYSMLRMSRQAKKFALTKFLIICLVFGLNILFITVMKTGISGVIWAQLIANIVGVIILLPIIYRNLRLTFDPQLLKEMFRFGFPTLPASLSQIILQVSDRIILNKLCGEQVLGLYTVNYRLGIPMQLYVTLFEYAWKPFYLEHHKDSDAKALFSRIFTYFTLGAALVFIASSLFMSDMVQLPSLGGKLINPDYYVGMGIIPVVLFAYYFNGAYNNFAAGIQITKNTKYLPVALLIAGAINIIANFIFIPIYGYQVAAWTTLLGYVIAASILYIFSQQVYPIVYEWKRLGIIMISTTATYLIAMEFTSFDTSLFNLSIKLVAVIAFAIMMKLFGFFTNQELIQLKRLLKRNTKKQ